MAHYEFVEWIRVANIAKIAVSHKLDSAVAVLKLQKMLNEIKPAYQGAMSLPKVRKEPLSAEIKSKKHALLVCVILVYMPVAPRDVFSFFNRFAAINKLCQKQKSRF